jgi:Mn-dependent DtxR family transcriptional regulator
MSTRRKVSLVDELKSEALKIIESSKEPLGVADVAKKLSISWATARIILLTLEAEGRIASLKTPKSRVYFAKGKSLLTTSSGVS